MPRLTFPRLGHVGRLGNQMWQIASTIGLARKHGYDPVFPDWDYRPFFSVPDHMFGDITGARNVLDLLSDVDERYREYLQDLDYFQGCHMEIRNYFQPSEFAKKEIESLVPLTEGVTSLHVRRGDNLRELTANSGWHLLSTIDYYKEAVLRAGGPAGPGSVLIFSDDISWCRTVLAPQLDDIGAECSFFEGTPRPDVEGGYWNSAPLDWIDMHLMALCGRHVIANSTFSWWAAFLSGDQLTIYPECWYGYRISYIPWRKMIPDTWIEIRC